MVTQTDVVAEDRWDKFKRWGSVQEEIIQKLHIPENMDHSLTLNHGPQLYHTLRHPGNIKCMTHFLASSGDIFVTHYCFGTMDQLSVWTMDSNERDASLTQQRFQIHSQLTSLMYVSKHRVYLGFSTNLELHIFTDVSSQCQEKGFIQFSSTVLCMTYNRDADEIYMGGIGTLDKWKVTGSEYAAMVSHVMRYNIDIAQDEWVIDIKVDTRNKQLLILTYHDIFVVNYVTQKQTNHLKSRHEGTLRCCSFYKQREYFITGGGDGVVKVWNAVVFTQVHAFYGHNNAITGLAVHKKDPLLFSSSLDGSVLIWRMDNFSKLMRFELSEKIYSLKLLSDEQFFCQMEKEIRVFGLNQFYNLFAPVESTVRRMLRCPGKTSTGLGSRIIASTEDGSVRLFSPLTGVALTLIYPMPSFQILTCFAYNRERERLHTVLENGEVIVFNCRTNPCKAVEVWHPAYADEAVTQMLQVDVSYTGENGRKMTDTVIFGGLENGQMALLDANVCEMAHSVQVHAGMVTCLEGVAEIDRSTNQVSETCNILVTGGNDNYVKLWKIHVSAGRKCDHITLDIILKIPCGSIPQHICMYDNILSIGVVIHGQTGKLLMYRVDGVTGEIADVPQYTLMDHAEDEDHTKQITALDKCPLLGLVASAGEDGCIKIWNRDNQLIREMIFGEPMYGLCFANVRGDLLFGFQSHVCSIPVTSYFPQNYLEKISLLDFQDDMRENPIPYNNIVKPWFDPLQLPTYSTIRSQRVEERNKKDNTLSIEDLEEVCEPTSKWESSTDEHILFKTKLKAVKENENRPITKSHEVDRIAENKKVDEEIEVDQKEVDKDFEFNAEVELGKQFSKDSQSPRSMGSLDKFGSRTDRKRSRSTRTPDNLDELTPWERALLKRKMKIIPTDGYVPNSVVRKRLGYVRPVTPPIKKKSIWTLQPVPQPDPRHMPPGWRGIQEDGDDTTDIFETLAPFNWADYEDDEESKTKLNPFQKMVTMIRTTSNLSNTSSKRGFSKASRRSTPVTPKYELKSKKFEFGSRNDLEAGTPDSTRGVRRQTKSGRAQSRERSKSFKLTNMVVDEDSTDVRYKGPDQSGKRGSMLGVSDMDTIQRLLQEDWFSEMSGTPSFDSIMQRLLALLDTDDAVLHAKVCDYIMDLHKDLGIPDMYLDRIIAKLSNQLGYSKVPIKTKNLKTLKQIGGNRADVLASILPRLIDSQADVRDETAAILADMVGVTDKDDLLMLMQDLGLKGKYSSKEEEEEALKALAMRLDVPYRTDSFTDWMNNWVDESSILYDDDDELKTADISKNWDGRNVRALPESLCITESSSRASLRLRELTNISDKSPQWHTPEKGGTSDMFNYNRDTQDENTLPLGPKSQVSAKTIRNSIFNPKDAAMYGYYKKRYPAYNRPGSGKMVYGGDVGDGKGVAEGDIPQIDSGHHDDVGVIGSELGDKTAEPTMETMSTQDSGIGRELSEVLSSKSGMETALIKKGHQKSKQDWPKHSLSPVKSAGSIGHSEHASPKDDKENWQRFLKTATAQERRRMEMVKRDFDSGKVKQSNGPAVIQYIASDLPLLPGEAGLRLLHTVRVGNKGSSLDYDGRHQVESIPGKLMVQTKNEDTGKSNFGILQMQWTTGVPICTSYDEYLKYRHMSSGQSESSQSLFSNQYDTVTEKSYVSSGALPDLQRVKQTKPKKTEVKKETQFTLPRLQSRTTTHSHDYQWERPLPPPPVHKSGSQSYEVRKDHEKYCKYYDLTKKKMQQYTSSKTKGLLLPEVVIRNALGVSPKLHKSLTRLSRGHSVILPPITLNQLIHVTTT